MITEWTSVTFVIMVMFSLANPLADKDDDEPLLGSDAPVDNKGPRDSTDMNLTWVSWVIGLNGFKYPDMYCFWEPIMYRFGSIFLHLEYSLPPPTPPFM